MVNGMLRINVPTGWSAPSTTTSAPGYVTSNFGTVSVSGQQITISGITRNATQTLTIVYGSKAGGGPNALRRDF